MGLFFIRVTVTLKGSFKGSSDLKGPTIRVPTRVPLRFLKRVP